MGDGWETQTGSGSPDPSTHPPFGVRCDGLRIETDRVPGFEAHDVGHSVHPRGWSVQEDRHIPEHKQEQQHAPEDQLHDREEHHGGEVHSERIDAGVDRIGPYYRGVSPRYRESDQLNPFTDRDLRSGFFPHCFRFVSRGVITAFVVIISGIRMHGMCGILDM